MVAWGEHRRAGNENTPLMLCGILFGYGNIT